MIHAGKAGEKKSDLFHDEMQVGVMEEQEERKNERKILSREKEKKRKKGREGESGKESNIIMMYA